MTSKQLDKNFKKIYQLIDSYQKKYSDSSPNIRLIAVSKTHPAEKILELYALEQKDFGESYLGEALDKINIIKKINNKPTDIIWHFIGRIQSNKTKLIAENFDWVHSVDRLKIAERLNSQRPNHLGKLKILLQINIDQDSQKAGFDYSKPDEIHHAISGIKSMPNLQLMGLMCILQKSEDFQTQLGSFSRLKSLLLQINQNHHLNLDTLSMGMSNDLEAAIAAGSTMVRVGSALFGPRNTNQ